MWPPTGPEPARRSQYYISTIIRMTITRAIKVPELNRLDEAECMDHTAVMTGKSHAGIDQQARPPRDPRWESNALRNSSNTSGCSSQIKLSLGSASASLLPPLHRAAWRVYL